MYSVDVQVDAPVLAAYQDLAQNGPRLFRTFVGGTVRNHVREEVERKLAVEPGSAAHPIQWQSEKQRRYVLGYVLKRDSRGNIIPYQRTHDFARGWFSDVDLSTMTISIGNSAMTQGSPNWPPQPLYPFLVGERQQAFHKNTGWLYAPDPILDIILSTMDILEEGWYSMMELRSLV